MKVYEFNTVTNELLNEYESMNQASFNSDMGYRGIWNQCHRKKCGNGGFVLTETYFSLDPKGITHNIVVDNHGGRYTNPKKASLHTGVSLITVKRHIAGQHTKTNFCGYKFEVKEV